mmetsp:Transcript_289/g.617  ORF Transcript_289/g.617 Transcript_289/m.617 type:complete len:930 (+) Transcript_289:34-2823(+)
MSDEPPPQDSEQQHAVEEEEEETYVGVVNPSTSEDAYDEAAELRAKLEKANHMIKTQNTAYQRAIRRAVLENDYVSKINNKLVQKVELQTREQGHSDKDLVQVQSICEDMKELITELADGKNDAEENVRLLTSNVAKMELAMIAQEGRVEELTSSAETTEDQINKLVADKDALNREVLSLRERKDELEKEKKGVSEALAVGNQSESKDEADAVSKAALQLISEKEELAKELLKMRLSHDKTTSELQSLQKRFEDAEQANESRISELTDAKRDAEKQVEELISSVEKMEAEASAKDERVLELTSTIESKEEQNKILLADKEALDSEVLTLRQQMAELEKDMEASTEAANTANTVVNSALNEQLVESAEEKAKIQQELDNLVKEKVAGDKVMGQKVAEVEDENKRLTNSINSLMNELILVNNDVNDSVPQPDNEKDDAEKSVATKVADHMSIISALRLKLRFFRKDNEDLQKSVGEKDEKLAQMEKDLESFMTARDSELAVSVSKVAAVEQAIKEEREKSDASIAERETEREEAELSKGRIIELEDQVSKLKELETDFVSNKTQLEEEVQILQSEKKSLEENEVNQRDQIEKLKDEIAGGAIKATELEESLEKERAEIQSISEKLEKLTKDVEITIAEACATGSAATTLDDVRRMMADNANTIANVQRQVKILEDEKRDVEDTLLSVSSDRDELEEKCELADEELRELHEKLESAVGMGVAFVDKAEKYKKDVAALTTKRDAAEQLAKEYHIENEANIAKCAQLEQTVASLQQEREVLEKESKAAIVKAKERLNKRMKDCDKQLTTLFPPLHPARKDNHLKFGDMISLLQKERKDVLAKIKALEEDVEAAQDESAILEQQVHILSKEVSKYAKEVSKHKRQNKDILRALNEVNVGRSDEDSDIPMDEVAVDAEVEKRLGKFKQFMYGRLSE